jgi:hypothetical protein
MLHEPFTGRHTAPPDYTGRPAVRASTALFGRREEGQPGPALSIMRFSQASIRRAACVQPGRGFLRFKYEATAP